MTPYDRQRNARLASNARRAAKRIDHDDLDCYYDDWAYFEPLTDVDDYPEESSDYDDYDEGECDVRAVGEHEQYVEPAWPLTDDVKECLEALWSFEDARRQALQVKATTKNVILTGQKSLNQDLFEKITRDYFAEIDAEVSACAEAMRTRLRELAESRFVLVPSYEHRWYNPAEDLPDEYPQRYRSAIGCNADWW